MRPPPADHEVVIRRQDPRQYRGRLVGPQGEQEERQGSTPGNPRSPIPEPLIGGERPQEEDRPEDRREAGAEDHRVRVEGVDREEKGRGERRHLVLPLQNLPDQPPGDHKDQHGVQDVDDDVDEVVAERLAPEGRDLDPVQQRGDRPDELDDRDPQPGLGELGGEVPPGRVLAEVPDEQEILAGERPGQSTAVEGQGGPQKDQRREELRQPAVAQAPQAPTTRARASCGKSCRGEPSAPPPAARSCSSRRRPTCGSSLRGRPGAPDGHGRRSPWC